jgi:acetyl-CoA C-acetyltransferase
LTAKSRLIYAQTVREIKVKSAWMSRMGRNASDYSALLAECVAHALRGADAGRLSAAYLSSFAPAELCGVADPAARLADALAASGCPLPVEGPFRTGGEAVLRALQRLEASGGDVLVVGCEKMTHLDAGTAAGLLAPRVSDPAEQRQGATLPALAALAARAYASSFAVPLRAFDEVAVKNHAHAARNPLAHFRREVTPDEVRASPLIADPLRRHHCAPMSDGAAACVLSTEAGDVKVRGWGFGLDAPRFHERAHAGMFRAATAAASSAFAMAGRRPHDVDVVEIHDAFAPFELMNLEAMGFFPYGAAWKALARGELGIGGRRAVNPSGGMKARGHPIGVCGLSSLAEVHAQLTASAGERQHANARVALIQSAGGVARDNYAFVLEASG